MKHINIAMAKMENSTIVKDEENLSIIERIVQKTGNPKIAAVLALDLFLVGVDTVSTKPKQQSACFAVLDLIQLISAIKGVRVCCNRDIRVDLSPSIA